MKKNNVDFDFQFRVRKYLEYCFHENTESEKEVNIYNKLSKSIKDEYDFQIYGKKLLNIPFFKNNFSINCLHALSKIIKKIDLAPEEIFMTVYININNFYNNKYCNRDSIKIIAIFFFYSKEKLSFLFLLQIQMILFLNRL